MSLPKFRPAIGAAASNSAAHPIGATFQVPDTNIVLQYIKNDPAASVHPGLGDPVTPVRPSLESGSVGASNSAGAVTTDISRSNVLMPGTGMACNSGFSATARYGWSQIGGTLAELNAKFGTSIELHTDGSATEFGPLKHSADNKFTLGSFGTGNVKGVALTADTSSYTPNAVLGVTG